MGRMAQLMIKVDLFTVADVRALVHPAIMANLRGAVEHVASTTRASWQEAVYRARLWSVERDAYAQSITYRMESDTKATVSTDYRLARQIEEGRPARDLKDMLNTSLKVRISKKGRRYLIIPFRHNTPGNTAHAPAMPEHVFTAAKALQHSRILGMGTRLSGTGAFNPKTRKALTVPQANYAWGGRLPAGMMGPNAKGKTDRYAGMVRMLDTSTAGKKKSVYLTFRIMAEGQSGWVVPAKPGLHLVRTVVQAMIPVAKQEFANAVTGVVL
jgi:hypothetical protein